MNVPTEAPKLPNFFIVGAPKCGTTAWVEYLRAHPDVFFPNVKDQCYFALDLPNFRLTKTPAHYAALYANCGAAKVVGEASAMYLFSTAAARAIRDHDPASKILIFLRGQEDYLPSLHNQFLWEFAEEIEDFETAWRLSGHRSAETIPSGCLEPRTLDYASMGRFEQQVGRYLKGFPSSQVCVIDFRDWIANSRRTYLQILDFLGLPDDGRTDFPAVNAGVTYRSRKLTRLVVRPPAHLRKIALLLKRITGPFGRRLHGAALGLARSAAISGYRDLRPELREEIRRYYADENAALKRRLARHSAKAPTKTSL